MNDDEELQSVYRNLGRKIEDFQGQNYENSRHTLFYRRISQSRKGTCGRFLIELKIVLDDILHETYHVTWYIHDVYRQTLVFQLQVVKNQQVTVDTLIYISENFGFYPLQQSKDKCDRLQIQILCSMTDRILTESTQIRFGVHYISNVHYSAITFFLLGFILYNG